MYSIVNLLIALGIIIIVFFIARELVCWYWKINKRNDLLEEQNELLEGILKQLRDQSKVMSGE